MPSVYVKTLGCKVNTFDSHALANQFACDGFAVLTNAAAADVTVVNTCSVTANADREARYLARRLRRDNPHTFLVFTGCYAQTDSAALVAMDEIDCVIPNASKNQLVTIVKSSLTARRTGQTAAAPAKLPSGVTAVSENRQGHFKSVLTFFDRAHSATQTRAFLKIQDGCDNFCTYCLIPYARGASRSVDPKLVIDEVQRLAAADCREIVLTGIHIGDYGRDLAGYKNVDHPIVHLLQEIFTHLPHGRIRISSLEPSEVTQELIELLAAHAVQVCDHFHLPLQSGDDRILKLMRRAYDSQGYAAAVALIRRYFPEASIGADVIPGFPGETEMEFARTLAFVDKLKLSYLHVFPYSKRPNTAAARMPEHVSPEVIKMRAARLREQSAMLAQDYGRQFIGRTLSVIWENDVDQQGRLIGHAQNYLTVVAPVTSVAVPGTLTLARLKGFVEQGRLLGLPQSVEVASADSPRLA